MKIQKYWFDSSNNFFLKIKFGGLKFIPYLCINREGK
jgi:hypothetical protein